MEREIYVYERNMWDCENDCYCDEWVTRHTDISEDDAKTLLALTPKRLLDYMRENCVGRCNTVGGTDGYFIPCLEVGAFTFSLQANYYLWAVRHDNGVANTDIVTAQEFDYIATHNHINGREVQPLTRGWDVAISLNGCRLACGQMSLTEVSYLCHAIALGEPAYLDSEP